MILMDMKNRILLSVYAIYCMRKLRNPLIAEPLVLAILMIVLFYFVSVSNVLKNMLVSESSYTYFLNAFSEADLLIQLILVSIGVIGLFLARNIPIYSGIKQRFGFI